MLPGARNPEVGPKFSQDTLFRARNGHLGVNKNTSEKVPVEIRHVGTRVFVCITYIARRHAITIFSMLYMYIVCTNLYF